MAFAYSCKQLPVSSIAVIRSSNIVVADSASQATATIDFCFLSQTWLPEYNPDSRKKRQYTTNVPFWFPNFGILHTHSLIFPLSG